MIDQCYIGDARDGLRAMLAAGVKAQTCVTSPPYWGLRDYGTVTWEGGIPDHEHDRVPARNGRGGSGSPGKNPAGAFPSDYPANVCSCGAVRVDHQLGLEPTPADYLASMVDVFRLVRDVLADDGTIWVNMGDSYSASGKGGNTNGASTLQGSTETQEKSKAGSFRRDRAETGSVKHISAGLKPKDMVGMPWRLALALQADGWWLRQDIIWHKPNPMPESIRDRCTKSHEYLFLLAKSERYYYDADAIKEPASEGTHARYKTPDGWDTTKGAGHGSLHKDGREAGHLGYERKLAPSPKYDVGPRVKNNESFDAAMAVMPAVRNKRSVWTIPTEAFPEAHFATFPTALVEPCILAGSRVGDIVLDPFLGSGTVAQVAQTLGRHWLGCELNAEYVKMQARRTAQAGLRL